MAKQQNKAAYLGVFTTLAMVFSYVEALMPPVFAAFPGIKMGLPNLVIVFALYCFGFKYAMAISLVRVLLSSLLFGNTLMMMYSLAGAVLSLLTMLLLKRTNCFSYVGVSVAGGIMHNLGQVIVAIIAFRTAEIGYYMIVLTFTGTVAGILIGLASAYFIKRLEGRIHF